MRLVLVTLLVAKVAVAQSAAPVEVPREASRLAAEYIVQKPGTTWVYQFEKARGRAAVLGTSDWRTQVAFSLGRRSGTTLWRVRDGAWLERSSARAEGEALVLPATLAFGTRWQAPASIERGGGRPAVFEIVALDATVALPDGQTIEQCLAVVETDAAGGEAITHFYAPNLGKVAVQGAGGWLYRLVEFRAGGRHGE